MKFVCPICREKLNITDTGSALCPTGHSFDRSRFGYYNLLVGASGGCHGDNREMILARREFLMTGAYSPLATRVAELVAEYISPSATVLDVGLGEGYYTSHIYDKLCDIGCEFTLLGFDISKDATRYAARRVPGATVAVASAYNIPIRDGECDLVVNIFSPLAREEIHRVMAPRAKFIMAIPDKNHLMGLKRVLYDTPYENRPDTPELQGFNLIHTENVHYTLTLDTREKIKSLFMMTPYAYRTRESAKAKLYECDTLTTEVEFILFVYEKI